MIKKTVLLLCAGIWCVCACKQEPKTENALKTESAGKTIDADTSYALGVAMASRFKSLVDEFNCDYDALAKGFREYLEGKETKFTAEEAIKRIDAVYTEMMEAQFETYKEEQTAFLAENAKKPEVRITASGLQYEVITEGTGAKPGAADTVEVHYEGKLIDGTVFDSSYNRGEPLKFSLQGVIPGWTEGLQLMGVGSKYRLFIPSDLGYGAQGSNNSIPPYSALIFEVELLAIVK
ncbi:MAG: FKBP-type peptidyl-prolyl cis-trans isomerase [Spirochaetaceae bacterium]|jgi:FKBP-type peptidyl-prolyl cis-trans isomerase|nr:FKBP-type peptidyl-prolyl cis-trans isomerase [Spirochaetaceae bacterium]